MNIILNSVTTGAACVNTNRKFIGIEKDENYFNIAKDRIDNHVKEKEHKEEIEDIFKEIFE